MSNTNTTATATKPAAKIAKKKAAVPALSANDLLAGAFGAAAPAAKTKSKTYPIAVVAPDAVDNFIKATAEVKAATATVKTARALIEQGDTEEVAMQWLKANAGQNEPKNLQANGTGDNAVLLQFKDAYPQVPRTEIVAAIGEDKTAASFTETFHITLKGDKVPEAKRTELVQGIIALMQKLSLNTDQTSEDAVLIYKNLVKPNEGFHAKRHTALTFEENVALQAVIAPTFSISVRNQTAAAE